ncbi:MAG: hypothetical protein ABSC45_08955 [Desulfobaccales bacterium]
MIDGKNPDVRFYISTSHAGYPRITLIFPWELSELDVNKYECHIDYFVAQNEPQKVEDHRLQQVSVAKKTGPIKEFDIFLSFCWPNLVFEASFFEEIHRLSYPIDGFRMRGYPIHLSQFIGFESINSHVSINNIKIKEIYP